MKKIYLIIILISSLFVKAQVTPGGINTVQVEYWLQADKLLSVLPDEGDDVTYWNDVSGNNRNFLSPTEYHPKFVKSSMNFNPSVDFYFLSTADGGTTATNNHRRKLESISNFIVDANKAYFVIWISRIDSENTGSYGAVFSMITARTDRFGWHKVSGVDKIWSDIDGNTTTVNSFSKDFGIGMSLIPNQTGTGALQRQLIWNGNYVNDTPRKLDSNGRTGLSVIGSADGGVTGDTNYFTGEVQELIVLSKPLNSTLTNEELKKINTYLGIKYGITLDTSVQPDYIFSDGTIIYNRNDSGYSNYSSDIVAIARDDASGLYQKQALSTDNPGLGIYLGDFADTNYENTSVMTDKSALVFGSTGLEGSSNYNYGPGTQFANYIFQTTTNPISGVVTQERVNDLSRNIYRAKVTGVPSFTVNVLPALGQWVVVSNNADFIPDNTTIYKVEGGVAKNVTIEDGDYVGFVYYMKAPGGVTNGLRMWLNASESSTITTNSSGQVLTWTDYAGFGTTYRRRTANNESAQYVQADARTNFHPTLVFDSAKDYLITDSGPMSVPNPLNSTFYTVVNHNFARDRSYFLGFGTQTPGGTNSRRPVYGVYRDGAQGRGRFRSAGENNSTQKLFNPGATMIAGYHWIRGTSIEYEFDAYSETRTHTSVTTPQMNGIGMLGAGSLTDSYLLGTMPEVFAYEGTLSAEERRKINSYLGLKYAITLDLDKNGTGVNYDYKFSDGTMVWEGNSLVNRGFHNNIASLIRDDDADLHNRQAKSTDVSSILHMGIGRKLGINHDLDYISNDKTALTWGHNGGYLGGANFAPNSPFCGELDSSMTLPADGKPGSVWLVDNVNFSQEVLIAAQGENFPYEGGNFQVFLLVADSSVKLLANQWDQMIPMAYEDGMHVARYNFSDKYTYVSFAAKRIASCDECNFDGVKYFDFTKYTWPIKGDKGPHTFSMGNDFNVKIEVIDPYNSTSGLRNNYPRRSSRKTLKQYRRGLDVITTKVSFEDNLGAKTSSATTFEVYDIDRTGQVLDDIQVVGYCNGSPVYPKMYYVYNKTEKSRYKINPDDLDVGKAFAKPKGVKYNGNSGYTNKRGRVLVEFENPVEEVQIKYTRTGRAATSSYIGIGPMEFYCPAPLPAPDEGGLIFTKQARPTALLCDVVDYTFRVVNTTCEEKTVNFSDVLPTGMVWVKDSFVYGGLGDIVITGEETNNLNVTGIKVQGAAETLVFRASAVFTSNASAGIYNNVAKLTYQASGASSELESTDRLTGQKFTTIDASAPSGDRFLPVIASITTNKSCFNLNGEIEVDIQINNPNTGTTFSDIFFESGFNADVFSYIPDSFQSSFTVNSSILDTTEEGSINIDGLTLPSGLSWLKFKVRASNDINNYEIDDVTHNPVDVDFYFEFFSESDDDCLESVFVNTHGEIEMSFCTVCYKAPITTGTSPSITDSNGFSAITSLNRANSEWVTLRGNAFLVIESQNKGFVITRLTTTQINALDAVEGMLVYDTTVNCLKLYNGSSWGCLEQGCVDE